jgi:hypothetical protein
LKICLSILLRLQFLFYFLVSIEKSGDNCIAARIRTQKE